MSTYLYCQTTQKDSHGSGKGFAWQRGLCKTNLFYANEKQQTKVRHIDLPTVMFAVQRIAPSFFCSKLLSKQDNRLFINRHPSLICELMATRKPLLLLLLPGLLLLRLAERQFLALLFQLPPRSTRFEPLPVALNFDTPLLSVSRKNPVFS